jgi:hypothetical protein
MGVGCHALGRLRTLGCLLPGYIHLQVESVIPWAPEEAWSLRGPRAILSLQGEASVQNTPRWMELGAVWGQTCEPACRIETIYCLPAPTSSLSASKLVHQPAEAQLPTQGRGSSSEQTSDGDKQL